MTCFFEGTPRRNGDGDNVLMKMIYFICDILKIGLEFGWNGIVYIVSIIWMIINLPLEMLGVTASNADTNRTERLKHPNRSKSKLKALKKDKRFAGKRSNMHGLRHDENDDDNNKLNNGNSTMYGGDGK